MGGRKQRKIIQREPSGRRSRAGQQREFAPMQARRLRDAALAGMADQKWGTELGRLFLSGKIGADQFAAGERWAEVAARYYAAIGAPSPQPKAVSLERGLTSTLPDPDSPAGAQLAGRDRAAVRRMTDAHTVLMDREKGGGKLVEMTVRAVCERGETVAYFQLDNLTRGLRLLAEHWSLTRYRRHGKSSE